MLSFTFTCLLVKAEVFLGCFLYKLNKTAVLVVFDAIFTSYQV